MFSKVLYEFPVEQLKIKFPRWIDGLDFSHPLKAELFQEIKDEKYGQVLNVSLDYVKEYIIGDSVVTDQKVIDYLDDHYGRPVKWRSIMF